jgi:hypothetical protein
VGVRPLKRRTSVKKADEYAKHAKECRALATQMAGGEQRDQLLKMAETWEVLAAERERTLRHKEEIDSPKVYGGDPGRSDGARVDKGRE